MKYLFIFIKTVILLTKFEHYRCSRTKQKLASNSVKNAILRCRNLLLVAPLLTAVGISKNVFQFFLFIFKSSVSVLCTLDAGTASTLIYKLACFTLRFIIFLQPYLAILYPVLISILILQYYNINITIIFLLVLISILILQY